MEFPFPCMHGGNHIWDDITTVLGSVVQTGCDIMCFALKTKQVRPNSLVEKTQSHVSVIFCFRSATTIVKVRQLLPEYSNSPFTCTCTMVFLYCTGVYVNSFPSNVTKLFPNTWTTCLQGAAAVYAVLLNTRRPSAPKHKNRSWETAQEVCQCRDGAVCRVHTQVGNYTVIAHGYLAVPK